MKKNIIVGLATLILMACSSDPISPIAAENPTAENPAEIVQPLQHLLISEELTQCNMELHRLAAANQPSTMTPWVTTGNTLTRTVSRIGRRERFDAVVFQDASKSIICQIYKIDGVSSIQIFQWGGEQR